MQMTFWGVRGSIPTPGQNTVQFGGNTSCVEVRANRAILIFDGGTGLRLLGKKLLKQASTTRTERRANRYLSFSNGSPCQQQVRHVAARNEQQHQNRA